MDAATSAAMTDFGLTPEPSIVPDRLQPPAFLSHRGATVRPYSMTMQDRLGKALRDMGLSRHTVVGLVGSEGVGGNAGPMAGGSLSDFTPLGMLWAGEEFARTGDTLAAVGALPGAAPAKGAVQKGARAAAEAVGGAAEQATKPAIRAYHGTPHSFDKFDSSKIGTGEGAQAYGHGLYFAEEADVARHYRDMGGFDEPVMRVGTRYLTDVYAEIERSAARMPARQASESYNRLALLEDLMHGGDALHIREQFDRGAYGEETFKWFEKEIEPNFNNNRSLYEVGIHANPDDFLDWDAPLGEQPRIAERLGYTTMDENAIHDEALRVMDAQPGGAWMDDPVAKARVDELQEMLDRRVPSLSGQEFYRGAQEGTPGGILSQMTNNNFSSRAEELREAGIPGIKYRDAMSRDGSGRETRNYVVFPGNEHLIEIVRKYGIAGVLGSSAAAGMMTGGSGKAQAAAMPAYQTGGGF